MNIIHGKNENGEVYVWKVNGDERPNLGDYAIVESKDTFAFVEIVGMGVTNEKYEKYMTASRGKIHKAVRVFVPRQILVPDNGAEELAARMERENAIREEARRLKTELKLP